MEMADREMIMHKHSGSSRRFLPKGLEIIHEDRDILAVDKPSGLLTMGTNTEKSRTAYFALTDYVRKGCAKSRKRIFIVHRLDKDTSGVLIFAKSEEAKFRLQSQWQDTKKKYLSVVHGRYENRTGTITTYLAEKQGYGMYSTSDTEKGKLASTFYKVIRETKKYSLLEIDLLTGRKHQIRVHMADSGHPVVGDKRYGIKEKTAQRLALHALSIAFRHPFSGKELFLETKIPEYFNRLVGMTEKTNAGHK
jgi:tRNA pseudouridine32 synthase/23S rRNA pseudouridine746 synthase/23S rRNA pseudouridine1911/1915/1917 synthase